MLVHDELAAIPSSEMSDGIRAWVHAMTLRVSAKALHVFFQQSQEVRSRVSTEKLQSPKPEDTGDSAVHPQQSPQTIQFDQNHHLFLNSYFAVRG